MEFPFIVDIENEDGTIELAGKLADYLKPGDIVLLEGNLGTGKTFLVNAICAEWDIVEVTSPTFALVNEYHGTNKVFHFDFYRIEKEEELYDIGFEEYLMDDSSITFIEWPNLYPNVLPKSCVKITITAKEAEKRSISISSYR